MTRNPTTGARSQCSEPRNSRRASALTAAARAAGLAVLLLSCASSPSPPEVCLTLEASPNLNQFDGSPHVVVVYFYPLQNLMAYRQTDAVELLDGGRPPGMTGDVWEITVMPGATRDLEEVLPQNTRYIGVLADFYSGPSQAVVEAECPTFGKPTIVLTASDVQVR
ncbi:MAG: type VI secretion system lipoprotein TssJ [Deltaproteobacteria bacterium]|nr:type VI secretion system lipoprotein TssJ [Deltaproteobacteria bacterium]MBW2414876.1 type VI secretion system lipoprotein TssJ [Deltaproteobacteria bacterium]